VGNVLKFWSVEFPSDRRAAGWAGRIDGFAYAQRFEAQTLIVKTVRAR
jgi:hypothetical protein